MGAKITLSRIPLPYSLWRALGVFRHGDMHDPEHAFSVFKARLDHALVYRPDSTRIASAFVRYW